jgi:hypothetical protein
MLAEDRAMIDDKVPPTPNDLEIIELDERLEFGSLSIDSDLDADVNTGCSNAGGCVIRDNNGCTNVLC